jgi:hypothetical protein
VSGAARDNSAADGASDADGLGDWAASDYVEPTRNTPATAGLAFGVLSFVIPVLGGALGLVFSVLGLSRANHLDKDGEGPIGRGKAIAGLVLSIIGTVTSVALLIFGVPALLGSAANDTGDKVASDGTQLSTNGNIPLELGAAGTVLLPGSDQPAFEFTVTSIAVDTACTAVSPENGQFLAVTMDLTTSADYASAMTNGSVLHVNASDWTTYFADGTMIANTDNGSACLTEETQFPAEIPAGTTVTGTIMVDTSADTTALSWFASEVATDDPTSVTWEWAIPR